MIRRLRVTLNGRIDNPAKFRLPVGNLDQFRRAANSHIKPQGALSVPSPNMVAVNPAGTRAAASTRSTAANLCNARFLHMAIPSTLQKRIWGPVSLRLTRFIHSMDLQGYQSTGAGRSFYHVQFVPLPPLDGWNH